MAKKKNEAKPVAIPQLTKDKKEALQNLIAAEAVYLHASGWRPYLLDGQLRWQHPKDILKRFLIPSEALAEQKRDDYVR